VSSAPLPNYRLVRWAIRATLLLGVAASVAANILHAQPNPISQMIAAWPPLALLLTVELISRVPMHRRSLAAVRLVATTAIAGIAAWVSYWHMVGVAARYGEIGTSPYLLPLSVDGLVIVASVSLVELAGRIRTSADAPTAESPNPQEPVAQPASPPATPSPRPLSGLTLPAMGQFPAISPAARSTRSAPRRTTPSRHENADGGVRDPSGMNGNGNSNGNKGTGTGTAPRQRRPVAETIALAAQIEADRPDVTHAEIAAELGISTSRLRAIRREKALAPAA
jgi:hypothetical protein